MWTGGAGPTLPTVRLATFSYRAWLTANCLGDDPLFFAIVDTADGQPVGLASYLRIAPAAVPLRWVISTTRRDCSEGRPPPKRCI